MTDLLMTRVVVTAAPGFELRASAIASDLSLATGMPTDGDLVLHLDEHGWGLIDPAPGGPGIVRSDLLEGTFGQRLRRGVDTGERLAKAMGLKPNTGPRPHVMDATAGLGRDSVLAAALGCQVIACERSPVVALLLRDGLDRAREAGLGAIVDRIDLRVQDAREVLSALAEPERPEIVILDPMFPERSKAAKVKKEMQLLHRLLGSDSDVEPLLDAARAAATRRVVVKRPAHAPPVGGQKPTMIIQGRTARYDVYVRA